MKRCLAYITILFFSFKSFSQSIPIDDTLAAKYPFVRTVFNRVLNADRLDSLFIKLLSLKKNGTGTISIVHIGDSHIQPDFLTGVVRLGLQQFFGNAGRGLIFPYQLAQSNAPPDIFSSSNTRWEYNRLAHPEVKIQTGISGYGIRSMMAAASLEISVRQTGIDSAGFNKLNFFIDNNPTTSWILQSENDATPHIIQQAEPDSSIFRQVVLEKMATSFTMASLPKETGVKEFYGVSLENSRPGVLYHSIGVNGARYDSYNNSELFWKQLPALNADLYIISLGTNEAQMAFFGKTVFQKQLDEFLSKLKISSPHSSLLITTAPDSYKGRYSNKVLQQFNLSMIEYCNEHDIPAWDLYRITNGFGSAYSWESRGLMSRDHIHFTADGYRLQGALLFNAFAKAYNAYIENPL